MKKWTAVEYDLSRTLTTTVQPKRVTIPSNIKLQLVIELDDKLFTKLSKDPTWIQKLQSRANAKAKGHIDEMVKIVKNTDQKAGGFDPKTAEIFSRNLTADLEKRMDKAGAEMAKESEALFEDYKKGKAELKDFRIKSAGKIALNSLGIAISAGGAAASGGGAAPLAIVGIVKSALQISQECLKLALSADQYAKIVQSDLKVLGAFMQKNIEKAKTSGKIAQGVKEIGLNIISGALGIETPSLKNCEEHIKVHRVDIVKLETQSHGLSKSINGAMDQEEKWRKKFEAGKKNLPADKVGKIVAKKDAVENALDKLIEATIKTNQSIKAAQERQEKFEKALESMKKGIPAWLGYVQEVTSLALTVGPNFSSIHKSCETAYHIATEAEKTINEHLS